MATAVQMEGFDSFYSILDVAPTASQAEIKKAYRVAAIKSHPDKGGNADTFRAVAEAYKVLSNDQTRATYDRYGRAGIRSDSGLGSNSGHRTWAPGTSPQDIFREMFGDQVDLAALFREMELQAARSGNPHAHNWGGTASARQPPRVRVLSRLPPPLCQAGLDRLVAEMQAELFAEDLSPPAEAAVLWSESDVRTFFDRGGLRAELATDGLGKRAQVRWTPCKPWGVTAAELAAVGLSWSNDGEAANSYEPLHLWKHTAESATGRDGKSGQVPSASASVPVSAQPESLLGLLESDDEPALRSLAAELGAKGLVVLPLGLEAGLCAKARVEAQNTQGSMQVATMPHAVPMPPSAGTSAEGAGGGGTAPLFTAQHIPRGDRHVPLGRYQQASGATAPVLSGLREALRALGASLTPFLKDLPSLRLQLTEASDAFIACVPAGSQVEPHFDSSCTNPNAPLERKLSLTVFIERPPVAESGAGATSGEYSPLSNAAELFFDDSAGMWRRLPETSETLVALSLSDRVLRKVARVADDQPARLTMNLYFLGGYLLTDEEEKEQRRLLVPKPLHTQHWGQPQPQQQWAHPQQPPPQTQQQPQPQTRVQPQFRQQAEVLVCVDDDDDSDDSDDREGAMDELG